MTWRSSSASASVTISAAHMWVWEDLGGLVDACSPSLRVVVVCIYLAAAGVGVGSWAMLEAPARAKVLCRAALAPPSWRCPSPLCVGLPATAMGLVERRSPTPRLRGEYLYLFPSGVVSACSVVRVGRVGCVHWDAGACGRDVTVAGATAIYSDGGVMLG